MTIILLIIFLKRLLASVETRCGVRIVKKVTSSWYVLSKSFFGVVYKIKKYNICVCVRIYIELYIFFTFNTGFLFA